MTTFLKRKARPNLLWIVTRGSFTGIVGCVVLLGYTPRTQPYFYNLLAVFSIIYVLARGENLFRSLLAYLTSRTLMWRWAFLAWAIASLFWSSRGGVTIDRAVTLIEIQILGLLFFDAAKYLGQTRWILSTVFVCSAAGAAFALAEGIAAGDLRPRGFFGNTNVMALISLIGLAAFYSGAALGDSIRRRMVSHVLGLVLVAGIVSSACRKGIAGVPFLWAGAALFTRTRARAALAAGLTLLVGSGLLGAVPTLRAYWYMSLSRMLAATSSMSSLAGIDRSFTQRVRFIRKGISLMAESPLIGRGLDSFHWLSVEGMYAHNNYIEIGVAVGLIGLALFYGFYAALFISSSRSENRRTPAGRFFLLFIAVTALLEVGFVSFYMKLPALLLITCAGWVERDRCADSAGR
jgi:O-antigen ligase